MRAAEAKRTVGYCEPQYERYCGNCRNCVRKGTHLRCARFAFAVQSLGICRNGWTGPRRPLNARETPLLTYRPEVAP